MGRKVRKKKKKINLKLSILKNDIVFRNIMVECFPVTIIIFLFHC
jgi:hypothetical protein